MKGRYQEQWKEFRNSGLLWFVNRLLHVFGWNLIYQWDKDCKVIYNVYPKRTKNTGFSYEQEDLGIHLIRKYMDENGASLSKASPLLNKMTPINKENKND